VPPIVLNWAVARSHGTLVAIEGNIITIRSERYATLGSLPRISFERSAIIMWAT
jgi:hypothetical protein